MSFEILPSETEIIGAWIFDGKKLKADFNEQRIDWLLKNSLVKVAQDQSGWITLYRNLHDERLWELTFPQGESQGGGPRKLKCLIEADAGEKYGFRSLPGWLEEKQR